MPRYTKICIDRLYNLFEEYADNESLTIAQIAVREKIDVTTLKRLFNRIANYGNLETRSAENVLPQSRANTEVINEIVKLRTCDYSFRAIGDQLGFSKTHIKRLYQRRVLLLDKYEIKHQDGMPVGRITKEFKKLLEEEKVCRIEMKR